MSQQSKSREERFQKYTNRHQVPVHPLESDTSTTIYHDALELQGDNSDTANSDTTITETSSHPTEFTSSNFETTPTTETEMPQSTTADALANLFQQVQSLTIQLSEVRESVPINEIQPDITSTLKRFFPSLIIEENKVLGTKLLSEISGSQIVVKENELIRQFDSNICQQLLNFQTRAGFLQLSFSQYGNFLYQFLDSYNKAVINKNTNIQDEERNYNYLQMLKTLLQDYDFHREEITRFQNLLHCEPVIGQTVSGYFETLFQMSRDVHSFSSYSVIQFRVIKILDLIIPNLNLHQFFIIQNRNEFYTLLSRYNLSQHKFTAELISQLNSSPQLVNTSTTAPPTSFPNSAITYAVNPSIKRFNKSNNNKSTEPSKRKFKNYFCKRCSCSRCEINKKLYDDYIKRKPASNAVVHVIYQDDLLDAEIELIPNDQLHFEEADDVLGIEEVPPPSDAASALDDETQEQQVLYEITANAGLTSNTNYRPIY